MLDRQIISHMFDLISDGDDALSTAQADPEKSRQRRHDLHSVRLFFILDHPDDDVQRIVKEVRVDLGL